MLFLSLNNEFRVYLLDCEVLDRFLKNFSWTKLKICFIWGLSGELNRSIRNILSLRVMGPSCFFGKTWLLSTSKKHEKKNNSLCWLFDVLSWRKVQILSNFKATSLSGMITMHIPASNFPDPATCINNQSQWVIAINTVLHFFSCYTKLKLVSLND